MYTKQLKAKHSYLSNTSMIRICLLFFYLYCFKINLQSMKGITNFISLNLLSHMHLISHILRPLSLYELKPENQSTKMLHWVFYKTDHPFVFLALWWQKNEQNLKKQFALIFLHLHHDLKMNCTTYILFLLCMQKQLYCLYWQTPLYAIWIKILTDYGIAILSLFESLILNGIPPSINTYLMMHLYIMLTPILDVWKKQ